MNRKRLCFVFALACTSWSVQAWANPFPVESHQWCETGAVVNLPGGQCPIPSFTMDLCINATPLDAYFTNRSSGVGVTRWNVTGTATLRVLGLNGNNPIPFNVTGSYVWISRYPGPGLNWTVTTPAPALPVPSDKLVGTNPTFGSIGLRIASGSGSITAGGALTGNVQIEISEVGDLQQHEGRGPLTSLAVAVSGTGVSTPGSDTDGDGINDLQDNAMMVRNTDQTDGDSDGLGNVIDLCPADPLDLCTPATYYVPGLTMVGMIALSMLVLVLGLWVLRRRPVRGTLGPE